MEIVFIRHGEPEWVREGRNVDNPPLTARGVRQAEAMAVALAGEHFDEVYCSPLVRARQTAAPLFAALGRSETIDPWLEEIRNPIWQGTPQDVASEDFTLALASSLSRSVCTRIVPVPSLVTLAEPPSPVAVTASRANAS